MAISCLLFPGLQSTKTFPLMQNTKLIWFTMPCLYQFCLNVFCRIKKKKINKMNNATCVAFLKISHSKKME